MACLCAPTSHEGSFRCRLHRPAAINPTANSAANNHHQIRGVNPCSDSSAIRFVVDHEIGCTPAPYSVLRESSSSASTAAPHRPSNDHLVRFAHVHPQVAVDLHHNVWLRSRQSAPSSASHTISWASTTSSSCRSSLWRPSPSSPSASRASASSSSASPSSPLSYTRPPTAKRSSSPFSSPVKSPSYRALVSSPSSPPRCPPNGSTTTPSAISHAAAMAIMKQHSQNKLHGVRSQNRSMTLSPTSASKIGPSRLSRMAVACTAVDDGRQLLKDEQCIDSIHDRLPQLVPAGTAMASALAETTVQRGVALLEAASPIRLNTRSAMNNFKQIESSCRIVGSKGESFIMPAVY